MAQLTFTIENQIIKRTDNFLVVALSRNYLYAEFAFLTPDWNGMERNVIFRRDETYQVITLDETGVCLVPHELLREPGIVSVSVYGTNRSRITTNQANFNVYESGYAKKDKQKGTNE